MKTKTIKKVEPKKSSKPSTKKEKNISSIDVDNSLHSKILNLESAYADAISGKIKFGEVKDMFKKLHKEIKSTTKK
jgi:hypothetical protein